MLYSTEKADGMFATIVVVLPSQFTGGAVHVSHGGLEYEYDCSIDSISNTTILAWYTDVQHEVKPVTSGYRLALAFNLIHTTKKLRPAPPMQNASTQRLRNVLASWQQRISEDDDEVPEKILYLLSHKYSQANLRGSALKGRDSHLMALLDSLARPLGFRLGLANMTCHISGTGDDSDGRGSGWGGRRSVGFGEVCDTDIDVENLVDLDGTILRKTLAFDEETETIPVDLEDVLSREKCDKEDYEGYMGNVCTLNHHDRVR